MNNVNKTLYIPLYGKAYVSRKGIILRDPKAEEIWAREGFPLKGKSRSKWLAYYMGMRSAVFDRWLKDRMGEDPTAVILHVVREHEMAPADLVNELRGLEKSIFRRIYAGGIARKLYRLYEYRSGGAALQRPDKL